MKKLMIPLMLTVAVTGGTVVIAFVTSIPAVADCSGC